VPLHQSDLSETDDFEDPRNILQSCDVIVEDLEIKNVSLENQISEQLRVKEIGKDLHLPRDSLESSNDYSMLNRDSLQSELSLQRHSDTRDVPTIDKSDSDESISSDKHQNDMDECKKEKYLATFEALLAESDFESIPPTRRRSRSCPDAFAKIQQLFKPLKRKSICLPLLHQEEIEIDFTEHIPIQKKEDQDCNLINSDDCASSTIIGLQRAMESLLQEDEGDLFSQEDEVDLYSQYYTVSDRILMKDGYFNHNKNSLDEFDTISQYYTVSDRILMKEGYYNLSADSPERETSVEFQNPQPLTDITDHSTSKDISSSHSKMDLNIPSSPEERCVKQRLKLLRTRKRKAPVIIPVDLEIPSPVDVKGANTWRRKLTCLKRRPKSKEFLRPVTKQIVKPKTTIKRQQKRTFRTNNPSCSARIVARKAERLRKQMDFKLAKKADYSHIQPKVKSIRSSVIRKKKKMELEPSEQNWYFEFRERFDQLEQDLEQCDIFDIEKCIEELKVAVDLQFPPLEYPH